MTSEQIDRMLSIANRYVTVYERNFALSIQRVADLKAAEERSAQIDAQNVAIRDREASAAERVSAGIGVDFSDPNMVHPADAVRVASAINELVMWSLTDEGKTEIKKLRAVHKAEYRAKRAGQTGGADK